MVWSPTPVDPIILGLDAVDGYHVNMFPVYPPETIKALLVINPDRIQYIPHLQDLALKYPSVWSPSPSLVNYPPVELAVKNPTLNMFQPTRPIHNPLALAACAEILTELEFLQIIAPIPPHLDPLSVNVPLFMVQEGANEDGSIKWRLVLDNRVINSNLVPLPFPDSTSIEEIWRSLFIW
jgi:hypothetical protein